MQKSLVIFENHFNNNTTLVFQMDGQKFAINGCQTFLAEYKEVVFNKFNVDQKYQDDVEKALAELNADCSENDLIQVVGFYPFFINRIEDQTPEICLEAVKQDGEALRCVKAQTPEICLEAVKQSGWALQFVKEQTPEICLEAVKQSGWALQYVNEQTPEIIAAAEAQIANQQAA